MTIFDHSSIRHLFIFSTRYLVYILFGTERHRRLTSVIKNRDSQLKLKSRLHHSNNNNNSSTVNINSNSNNSRLRLKSPITAYQTWVPMEVTVNSRTISTSNHEDGVQVNK